MTTRGIRDRVGSLHHNLDLRPGQTVLIRRCQPGGRRPGERRCRAVGRRDLNDARADRAALLERIGAKTVTDRCVGRLADQQVGRYR